MGLRNTKKSRDKKSWALDQFGRRCQKCKLEFEDYEYDFHHVDPSKKEPSFRTFRSLSKLRVKKLLEPCILLCANCHAQTHFEERSLESLSKDGKQARLNKERAVQHLGGKCQECGYNKCHGAIDFHHINPEDKLHRVGGILHWKWESIVDEINKCKALCKCCHRKEHWKE